MVTMIAEDKRQFQPPKRIRHIRLLDSKGRNGVTDIRPSKRRNIGDGSRLVMPRPGLQARPANIGLPLYRSGRAGSCGGKRMVLFSCSGNILERRIRPQYIKRTMNHFDEAAAGWDKNTDHVKRARAVAREIKKSIPLSKKWSALEFGSGTGLLSFMLNSRVKHITLIDNSMEMVKTARQKILQTKTKNISTLKLDLMSAEHHAAYDFIYALMSLHHIDDIPKILGIFFSLLAPGGYVCVADLMQEDGSFHSQVSDFKGHHGFIPEQLKEQFAAAGFTGITYTTVYTVKRTSGTAHKNYPLFLLTAKKP